MGLAADEDDLYVQNVTIDFMSSDTGGAGISVGRASGTFDTVSITCLVPTSGFGQTGVSVWDYGTMSFTNLSTQSCRRGMDLSGGQLTVRKASIENSLEYGIIGFVDIFGPSLIDLGTPASPGNNVIQSSQGIGVALQLWADEDFVLPAHGNTWRPSVQGADASGAYAPQLVSGPVPEAEGNNYALVTKAGTGVARIQF